jgi:ketosteroid isomerase-like protein
MRRCAWKSPSCTARWPSTLAQDSTHRVEETYAANAVLQVQNGESVLGSAATVEFFDRLRRMGFVLEREPREVELMGDVALESGQQQWHSQRRGSQTPRTDYIAVWWREQGTWRIVRELAMAPFDV